MMMMMNPQALNEYSDDSSADGQLTVNEPGPARSSSTQRPPAAGAGSRSILTYGPQVPPSMRDAKARSKPSSFRRSVDSDRTDSSQRRGSVSRSSGGSTSSSASSTARQSGDDQSLTDCHTIALLGGTGMVGQAFLHRALDAGYHVRLYATKQDILDNRRPRSSESSIEQGCENSANHSSCAESMSAAASTSRFQTVAGASLYDASAVKEALTGAHFVVCLLNDTVSAKSYPAKDFLTSFLAFLYPIMKQVSTLQLFLLQSTSLASDMAGATPVMSKVIKTLAHATGRTLQLTDNDDTMALISREHQCLGFKKHRSVKKNGENKRSVGNRGPSTCSTSPTSQMPHFHFMVIRPTLLIKDGPSSKRLCASKSQPGPFSISSGDLADFILSSLLDTKLYNSCPYVVSDSGF